MKKAIFSFFYFFVLVNFNIHGQNVIENINFDNYISTTNNDLQNHFYNYSAGIAITQIQINGITGGCLSTPNFNNWGNDNAIYCSKYFGNIGTTYITNLCFKYDSTQINPNAYERAMAIMLVPKSDPNHYLIATIYKTKSIELISYGASGGSQPLPLQQNHWFKFSLSTDFIGGSFNDQIDIIANVYDLGTTGTNTPVLVGTATQTIYDYILVNDTAISIGITGTRWGGSIYLDNFHFEGIKSLDSCIATGIKEIQFENSIVISPNPLLYKFIISFEKMINKGNVEVLNILGESVFTEKIFNEAKKEINLKNISSGIYFVKVFNGEKYYCKKIIVEHD